MGIDAHKHMITLCKNIFIESSIFEKFDIYWHQSARGLSSCRLNTTTAKWRWGVSARCLMRGWWKRTHCGGWETASIPSCRWNWRVKVCWLLLDCHALPQHCVPLLWLRMDDFVLLFVFSFSDFSEGTQRRDVGGGKIGEDGEWNDGITDERWKMRER